MTHITPPAQPAPVQPEYCDPSSTVYGLAEMLMSDCGHSSNNQRLLDRIAERIQRHIDAATPPTAPTVQEPVACLVCNGMGFIDGVGAKCRRCDGCGVTLATTQPARPAPTVQEPVALTDEQAEFESVFKLPSNCTKFQGGYAPTSYNAWEAQTFCARWEGWKARSAHGITAAPTVPLTDEQIQKIWDVASGSIPGWSRHITYARAIEAAHGITEKGQP